MNIMSAVSLDGRKPHCNSGSTSSDSGSSRFARRPCCLVVVNLPVVERSEMPL